MAAPVNETPLVFTAAELAARAKPRAQVLDADDEDLIDEIWGYVRGIRDPEHPFTLEQLNVLAPERIDIAHLPHRKLAIRIEFCPTVPHCSLASTIGLCLSLQISKYYPRAKLHLCVSPGSHKTEHESTPWDVCVSR
jgi:hypothetical protein